MRYVKTAHSVGEDMGLVGLGIILLIIGFLIGSAVLWVIGIICIVVGAILALARSAEGPWYRRWY